ncbi:MAG: 2-oxo-tetronate isomerase [Thiolinea sp.]
MPKFAANLSMMFNEHEFLERFAAASAAGFEAVEFLFPYYYAPSDITAALQDNGLTQALFNLFPGDWDAGERGLACLPGREEAFQATVERVIPYVQATGVKQVHMMAGLVGKTDPEAALSCYKANLQFAAQRLRDVGIDVLIEPINQRDMPGYFLSSTASAAQIIEELALPNIRLQFDIYHHQITHGDVIRSLEKYFGLIGHIQIAGVPERHEPDALNELNYPAIFNRLDELGYDGWIGCEYRPRGETLSGLGWLA